MSPGTIEFSIKETGNRSYVGIGDVARVLKGMQNAIYHIGEYLLSKGALYRKAGRKNKSLERRTELRFKQADVGSFKAIVECEPQESIMGKTLVEEAIEFFGTICNDLNYEGDWEAIEKGLNSIITQPLQKSRIIGDIASFWPGGDNEYNLEMDTQNFLKGRLERKRRPNIHNLAQIRTTKSEETTFGVLGATREVPTYEFEIRGPEGRIKVSFPSERHEEIRKMLSTVVKTTGTVEVDEGGNIKEISDLKEIKPLEKIPIDRILTDEGELSLRTSIDMLVSFDKQQWVLEHPILNIIAVGKDYDEALTSFQEDFFFLYEKYHLGDPEKMVGRALEIRKFLGEVLEGG